MLEGPPFDLLGPVQQRLIVRRLSEVDSNSYGFRSRAEERGQNHWKWVQIEFSVRSPATLMEEQECPDWIFRPWLERSYEEKNKVMLILRNRPAIVPRILKKVTIEVRQPCNRNVLEGWISSSRRTLRPDSRK